MTKTEFELTSLIDQKRIKLIRLIGELGLNHCEVIKVSQELDVLLNKYQTEEKQLISI